MTVCSKTDIGLVRQSNQDACAAGLFPGGAAWAVVCDGMGGANGGNVASEQAVTTIRAAMEQGYRPAMDKDGLRELMTGAVFAANAAVYGKSKEVEGLRGMGTTVVAAIVRGETAYIAHAGDSRAYFVGDTIRQLTIDHSMVQELVNRGDITEEEARRHPQKNIITRAVGVMPFVTVDFGAHTMQPGDRLLLCSDGMSNYADEREILALFHTLRGESLAEKLVELARDGGGGDNISVALIEP